MSTFLSIRRIERRLRDQSVETLEFRRGLNLLLGPPNSGKTTWLRMFDFALADQDTAEEKLDADLITKYESVGVSLDVGGERHEIRRSWAGSGPKTKINFDDDSLTPKEVQHRLLELLGIPLLHFPKGNPYSGQTWPELSFRMLLRHIYRQQRYWSDIADAQPEGERTACILQFLGIAENIFTDEYGRLVEKKIELEALRARREQFAVTLNELARDLLGDPAAQVAVTAESLRTAEAKVVEQIEEFQQEREAVITEGRDKALQSSRDRDHLRRLSEERAQLLRTREDLLRQFEAGKQRERELRTYHKAVTNERERLSRAADASAMLADIKVTHCPACDQELPQRVADPSVCVLCGQTVINSPSQLSANRLAFEQERVTAEVAEAEDLVSIMERDNAAVEHALERIEEGLGRLEAELRPTRMAVSAFVQQTLSSIDRRLGELSERTRQLARIKSAWQFGQTLSASIAEKEKEIAPLQEAVDAAMGQVDFDADAATLGDGISDYLNAMNRLRPNTWKHSRVHVRLSQVYSKFRVGDKEWVNALGGTDQLYFLMAYHYGLLTLSSTEKSHYPGLAVIDIPGEFAGESIRDLENFVVEPFLEILSRDDMGDAQVIISGSGFQGIPEAHRIELNTIWVA